jgi:hypothetical protein
MVKSTRIVILALGMIAGSEARSSPWDGVYLLTQCQSVVDHPGGTKLNEIESFNFANCVGLLRGLAKRLRVSNQISKLTPRSYALVMRYPQSAGNGRSQISQGAARAS